MSRRGGKCSVPGGTLGDSVSTRTILRNSGGFLTTPGIPSFSCRSMRPLLTAVVTSSYGDKCPNPERKAFGSWGESSTSSCLRRVTVRSLPPPHPAFSIEEAFNTYKTEKTLLGGTSRRSWSGEKFACLAVAVDFTRVVFACKD